MNDLNQPFWTLDDYRRFVRHPDYFARFWAVDRIEEQFPDRTAEELVPLLTDEDDGLQIRAAQAILESGHAERFEQELLAARESGSKWARSRITVALGRAHSRAVMPELIARLDQADAQRPAIELYDEVQAPLDALAYYPDPEARAALWRFIERYPVYDIVLEKAAAAVLETPDAETLPRLLDRVAGLPAGEYLPWFGLASTLTRPIGLDQVAGAVGFDGPPAEVEAELADWLGGPVPFSVAFIKSLDDASRRSYQGLLPAIAAEFAVMTSARGDDWERWLAAWRRGARPIGYRWRMVYTGQLIMALTDLSMSPGTRSRDMAAAALAALAQAARDEDDEARFDSPVTDPRDALLAILNSDRMNVMPDVVERVARLGPTAVPDLIDVVRRGGFWGQRRAAMAIEIIARSHPGSADAAVEPILNLIYSQQNDDMLEPAEHALTAIGPAAIGPAAERFGRDSTFDIFVPSALSEIPVPAALDALMAYFHEAEENDELDEMDIENLGHFGQMETLPFLKEHDDPNDEDVARVLYTIGLLNGYSGEEMERWGATARVVLEQQEEWRKEADSFLFRKREPEVETPAPSPGQGRGEQQRTNRQAQGSAQKKAQRKKKKKR